MKLCSITPVDKSKWMYELPYVMTLSHLVEKYPKYAEIAKNRDNNYVMVDNSIIEMGSSFSMERIYNAAKSINANEIILEDAYPRGPETIEAIERSLKWLSNNNHFGEFKLQAVCHGQNEKEFRETFNYINSIKEIDTIGIPKVLSVWAPKGERASLANIFTNTDKELHYLGTWNTLKELVDMPEDLKNRVRSCDTCLPSYYAIYNMDPMENRKGTIDLEEVYPGLTKDKYYSVLETYNLKYNNKIGDR